MPTVKIRDAGIWIKVKGNKTVYEYAAKGTTFEGMKFEALGVVVYEFSGEKN